MTLYFLQPTIKKSKNNNKTTTVAGMKTKNHTISPRATLAERLLLVCKRDSCWCVRLLLVYQRDCCWSVRLLLVC